MVKSRLYAFCILCSVTMIVAHSESSRMPNRKRLTTLDLKRTDIDVNDKLKQLHKVIDDLQQNVRNMTESKERKAKENAKKMQNKFKTLSVVITKLTQQNNKLYADNKMLRQDKKALVTRMSRLELELTEKAKALQNTGVEAWFRTTSEDLRSFLEENGLEHFASPQFSPLIAGVVSNGVVILPVTMTSFFMLQYVKQLNVLRILMALNLFDLGFAIAIVASSVLLLGDPFEGMRHISEVNFVFIQLVLGTVFWLTVGFLITIIAQNRWNKAWRYAGCELLLRVAVALDYTRRVWVPVMERNDLPIGMPFAAYVSYFVAAAVSVKLTTLTQRNSVFAKRDQQRRCEDEEILVHVVRPQ